MQEVKVIGYHNPKTGLRIQLKKCLYQPTGFNYLQPVRVAYQLTFGKEGYLGLTPSKSSFVFINLADALKQVDALIDKDQEYLYG